MASPREIIAAKLPTRLNDAWADEIMTELATAGYRITMEHPAAEVYADLIHRHAKAARDDFHGERRAKLFDLLEALRAEYPEECNAWEARFTPSAPSEAKE